MPARIYALAKELKLDSKVLVDLCPKAGIHGKGSALASLGDDEVAKLRAFIANMSNRSPARPAPTPGTSAPDMPIPVIQRPRTSPGSQAESPRAPSRAGGATVVPESPAAEVGTSPARSGSTTVEPEVAPGFEPAEGAAAVEPTPAAGEEVSRPSEMAPAASAEAPAIPPGPAVAGDETSEQQVPAGDSAASSGQPPVRRSEAAAEATSPPLSQHIPPLARSDRSGSNLGRLRTLGRGERRPEPTRKPGDKPPERPGDGKRPPAGPVIRVANMPVSRPPKTVKPAEPEPQKPDIKLPMDALRGKKPLGEKVREQLEKAAGKARETSKGGPGGPAPLLLPGSTGRDAAGPGRVKRGGKGAKTAAEDEIRRANAAAEEARKKRKGRGGRGRDEDDAGGGRRPTRQRRVGNVATNLPRKSNVVVELPCTVRSFCEAVSIPAGKALFALRDILGALPNINTVLDRETAELLAAELHAEVDFRSPLSAEEQVVKGFEEGDDDEALLQPRPPVVTFLGHVDHGKTSLLDRIIGIDVVKGEAGGITQHIRAYLVDKDGRQIAFVDTPGHEAFTEMRARGANVTDIAVLVVAADDGIMPQTQEAISHARAAGVPIVVALNKIDLYGVDVNRIMQQLATNDLLPTEWGGETEVVKCSAMTGEGMDELLETILTIAELHELKANPDRSATGTCLEAERHEDRGVVAKFLVKNGTLKVGDVVVCGGSHGRVKAMFDTLNPRVRYEEAPPSTPVNLTGLDEVPDAGERFYVVEDLAVAREMAEQRRASSRSTALSGGPAHISLETLRQRLETLGQDEVQSLNVILRADTRGSIEAILKEFQKLEHPEVQVKVLQAMVGGITVADVHLADASDAIIIGFNVAPDEDARSLSKQKGVEIRRYDIIYRVTEDLKAALEGMLKPEEQKLELGRALVQRVFSIGRANVAGCRVMEGTIRREPGVRVRVIRNSNVIGDYPLDSLRREKDDAKEVREGLECGIKLSSFNDIKEMDVLEAYKIQEVARTL